MTTRAKNFKMTNENPGQDTCLCGECLQGHRCVNEDYEPEEMVKGNSSNSSTGSGNTKQIPPSRHWCFTLNNYKRADVKAILDSSNSSILYRYVFQQEIGGKDEENSGTPHLQGYIDYGRNKKGRPKGLFEGWLGHSRTHWEKCRNVKASIRYCQKKETRSGKTWRKGIDPPFKIEIKLRGWQEDLCTLLDKTPDDRTIHWIHEPKGCTGKTTFAKYVFLKYERVIVSSGKGSDMKNGVIDYLKKNDCLPRIILINIPRSNQAYVSYTGIEQLKDMFFYSGKYEGGMICGANPHVICFANEEPNLEKMSKDRWVLKNIGGATG